MPSVDYFKAVKPSSETTRPVSRKRTPSDESLSKRSLVKAGSRGEPMDAPIKRTTFSPEGHVGPL